MNIKGLIKRTLTLVFSCLPKDQKVADIYTLGTNELLQNRLALITGGTSGIGKSIAIAFLKAGADVIITGRSEERLMKALEDIRTVSGRGKSYGFVMDNSVVSSMVNQFDSIVNSMNGRNIDILVNNAGISYCPVDDDIHEEEGFVRTMDTNLKGTYFLSRIVSKYMIQHKIKGNILNIASTSSNRPVTNAYSLSKWGIKGLTLGMAKVLIKHDIVVNGLAPGPTATPMMLNDNNINLPNNPSGRFALPEEIASMAVVLTSKISRMVVGDIVFMGGGSGTITIDDIKY